MMNTTVEKATGIHGVIQMPGDKSIAHRAMILGALARTEQLVDGLPDSADLASTAACLRELGCLVELTPDGRGRVLSGEWLSGRKLFAGNSGTTARLLAGLVAGKNLDCTIDGDESLRKRPMARVAEPLIRMGADVQTGPGGRLPLRIRGARLTGITYRPPVASAQIKTAVLIAGLHAEGNTTVVEERPSRDHTENMLSAMGVPVARSCGAVTVTGGAELRGIRVEVPGDISSASFFVAAASLVSGSELLVRRTGVNPTRSGVLQVFDRMGADVSVENLATTAGEPVGDLIVRSSPLRGTDIAGAEIPSLIDELPVLAVVATQAEGVTTVRGAAELRHKETDRIRAIVVNLTRLGADIEELEDGFVVTGPCRLRGQAVSSFGDHRIAMSMAVAGLVAEGTMAIEDSAVVDTSYPGFFSDLRSLVD